MKIFDIELSGESRGVYEDVHTVRVTLRLHGVVAGTVKLHGTSANRRTLLDRAVRRTHRRSILEEVARRSVDFGTSPAEWKSPVAWSAQPDFPGVDIAICTRERQAALRATLNALVPMVSAPCRILVIDNAPTSESTRHVAEEWGGRVAYHREPTPGLDHARNRAIALATADVIAFVDDDVIVDASWLPSMRRAFANPDVAMVTGLVEPFSLDTEAERAFEAFGGFGRGYTRGWYVAPRDGPIAFPWANTGRFGTGANLAVRREMLLTVGGFDAALDTGTPSGGGGDLEVMFRVLKAGGLQHYAPQCLVRHMHRTSLDDLARQIRTWGSGMSAHLESIATAFPEERVSLLQMNAWRYTMRYMRRLALSAVVRPAPFAPRLAWTEFAGALHGARLYREGQTPGLVRRWNPPQSAGQGQRDVRVELSTLDAPVSAEGARAVQVAASFRGRPLDAITFEARNGWVGRDRIRDCFLRRHAEHILGEAHEATIDRIARHVTGAA